MTRVDTEILSPPGRPPAQTCNAATTIDAVGLAAGSGGGSGQEAFGRILGPPDGTGRVVVVLPAEPTFFPCPRCGERTMAPGWCFDCSRLDSVRARAREQLEESIPDGFRWAREGAEVTRVTGWPFLPPAAPRMVFTGPAGTGKTSMAVAMARRWVEQTKTGALFVDCTRLATARARTRYGKEPEEVIDAMRAPLAVLDEFVLDLDPRVLRDVLHYRYDWRLPSWVTTWCGRTQIASHYGDGVARRLFEGAVHIDLQRGRR